MSRVEIPAPGDLIMDDDGNVRANETVSLTLAGTSTDVTHYSALTGGTSTTGGLKSGSDGTIVDGSGNRRYVDEGLSLDLTILARTRQIEALSGAHGPLVEATPTPTLYVTRSTGGSDSNDGRSPGRALQTINKAVDLLNQGTGGRILTRGVQVGPYSISKPIHCVQPISIEGMPTHDTELDRTFGTPAGRSVWDAITTAAGSSVQSATAAFVAGDIGKVISVYGAGTGGGTFYDFISAVPDGTHATLTGTTPVARNSTTDPKGVKCSVVGDWDRVVTDAAIAVSTSILTSATAAFTDTDIGTELVIAGAGDGGQALRAAILSRQSATQVTICGIASTTVSGKRCVIRVIFGDMITFHASGCGLKALSLYDRTTGQTTIGAALKMMVDQGLGGIGAASLEDLQFSSTDTAGAWEHAIDVDGSWNQGAGGGGFRQTTARNMKIFGTRRPTETIRLVNAIHAWFTGGGIVASAPTTAAQGILILDPQKTAGGATQTADIHFAGCEALATYYYTEGQYCTFHGGRLGAGSSFAVSGRVSVELGPTSDSCSVVTVNADTRASQQLNSGTNNTIITNRGQGEFVGDIVTSGLLGVGPGAAGAVPTATVDVVTTSTNNAIIKARTASWGAMAITANGATPGNVTIWTTNATALKLGTSSVAWLGITTAGNVVVGGGAKVTPAEMATSDNAGFLYVPSANGVPSGTPAAITGGLALAYDRANNQIYVYNGAWKKTVALT